MMKKLSAFTLIFGMAAAAVGSPANSASLPMIVPHKANFVVTAADDCAAAGQRVAAAQGGTLTKATPAVQGGRNVCVIVVLVPGRDGERPRRVEVAVPAE
ncbi:hypothetical protein ACI0FM_04690 [Paenochrobactrum sp. BZR 588]|uniref:hypothetical protein n=1 Tax=Paenochrobactrum TaxID=999488 RepID=UPI0035BC3F81